MITYLEETSGKNVLYTVQGKCKDIWIFLVGNVAVYIQRLKAMGNILHDNSSSRNLSLENFQGV